jgi:hypothetical protein
MTEKTKPATATATKAVKKPRQRSPNYPAIGLEKALERLQPIREQAGRHSMPVTVAFEVWNYKSAAGDQTVAALKAFGLIEVQGAKDKREVRLTEAAWRILGHAPDREELLKVAALKPEIHKKLWEKYGGPPPADSILKNYLVWESGFNASFVGSFIAQYRATLAYANITASDSLRSEDSEERESEENAPMEATASRSPSLSPSSKPELLGVQTRQNVRQMTELAFKLSREADAKIVIYGNASREAIQRLQEHLKISEDAFPSSTDQRISEDARDSADTE